MFAFKKWFLIGFLPLLLLINSCDITEDEGDILILSLDPSEITLTVAETTNITATLSGIEISNEIAWSSGDTSIATVTTNGTVTGVKPGITTITATTTNGNHSASAKITVKSIPVTEISLSLTKATITNTTTPGSIDLSYSITPTNATYQEITWTSSSDNVATVDNNGKVTGVGPGETIITVTTTNGNLSASATITVVQAVTNISLSPNQVTITNTTTSGSIDLSYSITPANATYQGVTWTSSSNNVATVDNGKVTGVGPGTTTITVTTTDGGFSASATVTVFQSVTNITLTHSSLTLQTNKSTTLEYTIFPTNANDQGVTWSSEDTNVATVDDQGMITGITKGETTITVTATNGGSRSYSNSATITVSEFFTNVTGISFSVNTATLTIEGTTNLNPIITPADANDKRITWSSGDTSVATVDNHGKVTGKATGTTTITATTVNGGHSASATITVFQPVTGITLSPSTAVLTNGGSTNLTATITPANASDQGVTWSSSSPNVATVASDGTVTGVNPGVTTITITATNGGRTSTTATSTVTVLPDPPENFGEMVRTSCEKNTTAALKWDASAGATSYQLVYGTTTTNVTDTSYTATGLTPNTEYEFQVKACFGSACSAPSADVVTITTDLSHLGTIIAAGRIPDLTKDNLQYDKPSRDIFSLYKSGAKVEVRYLTPNGDANEDGSNPDKPARNLLKVMNGITDASEDKVYLVLLAGGTYLFYPPHIPESEFTSIKMQNYVAIIGGGNDQCMDFSNQKTTINANGTYYFQDDRTHTQIPTFYNENLNETALLYRVVIHDGYNDSAYGAATGLGGGMYNKNSSPTLIEVTFSDNTANYGGGMYNDEGSAPTLIGVTFSENTGGNGLGMYNRKSYPFLNGVTFSENRNTASEGGGMYNEDSAPILVGVTFSKNQGLGPAMYNKNSAPILIGNTFYGNTGGDSSGEYGDGIYNDNNEADGPTIVNSIVLGEKPGVGIAPVFFNADNSITEKLRIYDSYIPGGTPSYSGGSTDLISGDVFANSDFDGVGFNMSPNISMSGRKLILYFDRIDYADPNVNSLLTDEGGPVKVHTIPDNSVGVNKGIYVKMSGTYNSPTLYYSQDGNSWYTDLDLSKSATLPTDVIDLTEYDATGYRRTGRPDLGAYEAR